MKKILFLFLGLFFVPLLVHADVTKYDVVIEDNNVTVKVSGTNQAVTDYSNILSYQNKLLTIKEGSVIKSLIYNDIDLTITTNNKVAYLGEVRHGSFPVDSNVHHTLKFQKFKNDADTPFPLSVRESYGKIEVVDSTIYQCQELWNNDSSSNQDAGVTIKNTTIEGGNQIDLGGPVYIEDSTINGLGSIHSERRGLEIINSSIDGKSKRTAIYTESMNGYMRIINSNIKNAQRIYTYDPSPEDEEYSLEIVDSEIEAENINLSGSITNIKEGLIKKSKITLSSYIQLYNKSTIENSEITAPYLYLYGGKIKNSNLDLLGGYSRFDYYNTAFPVSIENSNVKVQGFLNSFVDLEVKDSNLDIKGKMYESQKLKFDGSKIKIDNGGTPENAIESRGKFDVVKSNVELLGSNYFPSGIYVGDSKLRIISLDNYALYVYDDSVITNSNVYLEAQYRAVEVNHGKTLTLDDDVVITDKDYKNLIPSTDPYMSFIYQDEPNVYSKSLMFASKIKVTFKIKNGTWSDGKTDDIVLEKTIWGNLEDDDVPVGMKANEGYDKGTWDKEIVYNDLTEEYEYTYTFEKKKETVKKSENKTIINPQTWDNISFYIMTLIISFIGFIYTKKKICDK